MRLRVNSLSTKSKRPVTNPLPTHLLPISDFQMHTSLLSSCSFLLPELMIDDCTQQTLGMVGECVIDGMTA